MRVRLMVLVVCVLFAHNAFCLPVSERTAMQVARNFWSQTTHKSTTPHFVNHATDFDNMYLFVNENGGGFVLVSADDAALPILGYSTTSAVEAEHLPDNVKEWLSGYQNEIEYLQSHHIEASEFVKEEWFRLQTNRLRAPLLTSAVSPLLATTWDQSPYYNALCPYDNTYQQRAVTGCVATATAQVMKYWEHPYSGEGSHSYVDNSYGLQYADFGNTVYNWDNMPNYLTSSSSSSSQMDVATLMYHVGVAVEMEYGVSATGGSGAHMPEYYPGWVSAEYALKTYFKYNRSTLHSEFKEDYTDTQWCAMLRAELDAQRPLIYQGYDSVGGHCFVCDGYTNDNQFHFNWGWSGYCDGYYVIGALNPAPGGAGGNATYTFNIDNAALFGLMPDSTMRVSPETVSFMQPGGVDTVRVSSCVGVSTPWTATSSQSWLTVSPTSGLGNGVSTAMIVTASANNTGSVRSATVTVQQGGQTSYVQVLQSCCMPEDMCMVELNLQDSYGDGWNGASILVRSVEGVQYGTYTIENGNSSFRTLLSVCSDSLELCWNSGSYDDECSFSLAGLSGEQLISVSYPTESLYVVPTPCIYSTPCESVTTLPLSQDFSMGMGCWRSVAVDQGTSNMSELGIYQINSTTNVFRFSSYAQASDYNQYLISPRLALSNDFIMEFDYANSTASGTENFKVLYSTTDSNLESFTHFVQDVTSTSTSFSHFSAEIPSEAKFVAIDYYSNYQYRLYVTNILLSSTSNLSLELNGPSYATAGTAVEFVATSSDATSFSWTIDGVADSCTTSVLHHVFDAAGVYQVVVSVSDGANTLTDSVSIKVYGDTMYYDDGHCIGSLSTGTAFSWAIKFVPQQLVSRTYLYDVMLYVAESGAGSYGLSVYQGGETAPQILKATQDVCFGEDACDQWNTVGLLQPVAIDTSQSLWIVFSGSNDNSAAAVSNYSGEPFGSLISLDGTTWNTLWEASSGSVEATWMIRAVMVPAPIAAYWVSAEPSDSCMGTVTGSGEYESGSMATLTAIPYEGYRFVRWSNDTLSNPYSFSVVENVNLTAEFAAIVAIDEAENDAISIYPNPTTGVVTFKMPWECTIAVYDAMGRKVYEGSNVGNVDLSSLDDGIYTACITTPRGMVVRKVVKR